MENNLWKILNIIIENNIIKRIDVYIEDLDKYSHLSGYKIFQSSENVGSFYNEEAIFTILKDIGFNKEISLNLYKNSYEVYTELSNFTTDFSRVRIDDELIILPYSNPEKIITKVTLREDESIDTITVKLNTTIGSISTTSTEIVFDYITYIFLYAICTKNSSKEELEEKLKKQPVVITHTGSYYNYYRELESGSNKIVKKVRTVDGTTYSGVFLVDTKDTLLEFLVIEKSNNLQTSEELYKDTIFYISYNNIIYMQ